jgi:hypothetical protein
VTAALAPGADVDRSAADVDRAAADVDRPAADVDRCASPAARAAAVWGHRARIELEAAALFEQLAWAVAGCGHQALAARAWTAADDERRHAGRC